MQNRMEQHPLLKAAQEGNLAEVNRLLAANPGKDYLFARGHRGQIALHCAVFSGNVGIVRALIEREITYYHEVSCEPSGNPKEAYASSTSARYQEQIRVQDNFGNVPFSLLHFFPNQEVALYLLDHNAAFDTDVRSFRAVDSGDYPIKDTELEKTLTKIKTLFELAEEPEQFDACEKLFNELVAISSGRQVANLVNKREETLLHRAAKAGNLKLVKLLHRHQAMNRKNIEGQFPIQVALAHNRVQVAEFFVCNSEFIPGLEDISELTSYCIPEQKESTKFIKAYTTAFDLIGKPEESRISKLDAILSSYPLAVHWLNFKDDNDLLNTAIYCLDADSADLLCRKYGCRFNKDHFDLSYEFHDALCKVIENTNAAKKLITCMFTYNSDTRYELDDLKSFCKGIAENGRDDLLEFICGLEEIKAILTPDLINSLLRKAIDGLYFPNILLLVTKYNANLQSSEFKGGLLSRILYNNCHYDYRNGDLVIDEIDLLKAIRLFINHHNPMQVKNAPRPDGSRPFGFPLVAAYLLSVGCPFDNLLCDHQDQDTQNYLRRVADLFRDVKNDSISCDEFEKLFLQVTQHPVQKGLHKTLRSLTPSSAGPKEESKEEKVTLSLDESDKIATERSISLSESDFCQKTALEWVNKEDNTLFHLAATRTYKNEIQFELFEAQKQVGILKFLLDQGFDPNQKNAANKTAEDLAKEAGPVSLGAYYFALGYYLLEKRAVVEAANYFRQVPKQSPFYVAACGEIIASLHSSRISFDGKKYVAENEAESKSETNIRNKEILRLCYSVSELVEDKREYDTHIDAILNPYIGNKIEEKKAEQSSIAKSTSLQSVKRTHSEAVGDADTATSSIKRPRIDPITTAIMDTTADDISKQPSPSSPPISFAGSRMVFMPAHSTVPTDDVEMKQVKIEAATSMTLG